MHCTVIFYRVGASHVHLRCYAEIDIFHVYNASGCSPNWCKSFQLDGNHVEGALTFEPPMLFAIGFIVLFTFSGFSGLMLGIVPADYQYQDTYMVVGHFHYSLVPGVYFAIIAGVYDWLPKWTGRMYCFKLANWHYWTSVISVNLTFLPMHFVGLAGMPRRIPDYALQFAEFNQIASIGACLFGLAQLIFVWLLIKTVFMKKGTPATPVVWEAAKGLEWSIESPAPYHGFMTPPHVPKEYRYDEHS